MSERMGVLRLAMPVLAQQLVVTLMMVADTAMLGWLDDPAALAALGGVAPVLWMLMVFGRGVGTGAFAVVARRVGEGAGEEAAIGAAAALRVSLVAGALAGLAMASVARPVATAIGLSGHAATHAVCYVSILGATEPFAFFGLTAASSLRAAGDTFRPMLAGTIANVTNVLLNWLLIFGKAGFPQLGVAGAAIATAFSQTLNASLLAVLLGFGPLSLRFRHSRAVRLHHLRTLARPALPALGYPLVSNTGYLVFTGEVATLGELPLAAHRIAIAAESLSFLSGDAFGVAGGSLVGRSLGAGDVSRARRLASHAMFLGVLAMGAVGVLLAAIPQQLSSLISATPAVRQVAARALPVAALGQVPFALCIVLSGVFNGAGATRLPLYAGAVGMWLVRIPMAWLLAHKMQLGLAGAWGAAGLHFLIQAILMVILFAGSGWSRQKI